MKIKLACHLLLCAMIAVFCAGCPNEENKVAVPSVTGIVQAAAEAVIEVVGLTVGTVDLANSDTVPEGAVISQDPPAGTCVDLGSAVNLVVSSGPVKAETPTVAGDDQAAAEAAILDAGLQLGSVTYQYSATVPEGEVISQDPPAGEMVVLGTVVNLVISRGPAEGPVPSVEGMTLADAEDEIEAASLQVGAVTFVSSSEVAAGLVVSQDPAAAVVVDLGSLVNLAVSTGPEAASGGKVAGWVLDPYGWPLPDVIVELDQPTKSGIGSTSTNIDGFYVLEGLDAQQDLIVRFSRFGYAATTQHVDVIDGATSSANATLLRLEDSEYINPEFGGTVSADEGGPVLQIPPNAFTPAKPFPMAAILIQLTALDIYSNDELAAFPGNFLGVSLDVKSGGDVSLETLGAVNIFATDSLYHSEVDLAEGATATLEMPIYLPAPGKFEVLGRTWWFNTLSGLWEERLVEGRLAPASNGMGLSFYLDIDRFGWWCVSHPVYEESCVSGRVVDDQGNPIPGAEVEARGINYLGSTYATADADGAFCLAVKAEARVELLVTTPGAVGVMANAATISGSTGTCQSGGCKDIGDIRVVMASCVSGTLLNAEDQPMAGITVYSSAGTSDITDQSGSFCMKAPADWDLTVWTNGGTSALVYTGHEGTCPGDCPEVTLRSVRITGGHLGTIVASYDFYKRVERPFLVASFYSGTEESLMSLGYLNYLGISYGELLLDTAGAVDQMAVYNSEEDFYDAVFGCNYSPDTYEEYLEMEACLNQIVNETSPLDPGVPGSALFEDETTLGMVRAWDLFDWLYKSPDPFYRALKKLSYGQFVTSDMLYHDKRDDPVSAGPIEVSFPGGRDLEAFSATVPETPRTVDFNYPPIHMAGKTGDAGWWFDGDSSVTLDWVPQDPSMSLLIIFEAYGWNQLTNRPQELVLIIWAQDDGSYTIPQSAFAGMPSPCSSQEFGVCRLALRTTSVATSEGGSGTVLLESQSLFYFVPTNGDDFTLAWGDAILDKADPGETVPDNDNVADAQLIAGTSGAVLGSLTGATTETFETDYDWDADRTVWYTWTAPENTVCDFYVDNDVYLFVYKGLPPFGEIVYSYSSYAYVYANKGEEFYIGVWDMNYDMPPEFRSAPAFFQRLMK